MMAWLRMDDGFPEHANLLLLGVFSGGKMWGWDWPHVQSTDKGSPSNVYKLSDIATILEQRFGRTEK